MVVGEFTQDTDILVIGGGPAGRGAAVRAVQLGRQVILVDPDPPTRLSGVECLVGRVRLVDKRSAQITGDVVSRVRFAKAIICTGCVCGPFAERSIENEGDALVVAGSHTHAVQQAINLAHEGRAVTLACHSLLPDVDHELVADLKRMLQDLGVAIGPEVVDAQVEQVSLADGVTINQASLIRCTPLGANVDGLDLDTTRATLDAQQSIVIDDTGSTGEARLKAAGAATGVTFEPAGAHRHGQIVAEAACGLDSAWDPAAVVTRITDHGGCGLLTFCGLHLEAAIAAGLNAQVVEAMGDGVRVRLIFDAANGAVLGVGGTGPTSDGLAQTAIIAIEMAATIEDLAAIAALHTDGRPCLSDVARLALDAQRMPS